MLPIKALRMRNPPSGSEVDVEYIASTSNTASSTICSVDKPSGTQEGDLIVICQFNSNQLRTVSSAPSGFSESFADSSASNGIRVYSKVAGPSEPSSYSITLNTSDSIIMSAHTYRGVTSVNTVGSLTRGSGATVTANSVTPSAAGVLLGLFSAETTGRTVSTPPSGMTHRRLENALNSQAVYDLIPSPASASGNKSLTWDASTSAPSAILLQLS